MTLDCYLRVNLHRASKGVPPATRAMPRDYAKTSNYLNPLIIKGLEVAAILLWMPFLFFGITNPGSARRVR